MNKDKEWLKEEVWKQDTVMSKGYIYTDDLMSIINELDEPQKPVIPQFVADYIEQSKKDNDSINQVFAFMDDKEDKDLWHWLFPFMHEEKCANQEVFMRAWLDGYEVEKEKKYLVKLPHESDMGLSLYLSRQFVVEWVDEEIMADHITESEIKEIDERYWAFAEEVTK